jgi:F420-dependent oxidoreductase-like protein
MELGYHMADFNWKGGPENLASTAREVATSAEAAGVARLAVMDHVWQIPGLGQPQDNMLEAYTTLAFLAAHTDRVLLHTMVTGAVYRPPGLLAKIVTTLDVLSGGRAGLGIGAAWHDEEAKGVGLPFPAISERFERLEEAVKICLQMWSESEAPFEGKHYRLERTLNQPQSLSRPRPYLLIGGSGERKTLPLVAEYADAWNFFDGSGDPAQKSEVLREHCERLGRDYDEIEKTCEFAVQPTTGRAELLDRLGTMRDLGFTVSYLFSVDPEPQRTIALMADVIPEVSSW